MAASVVLPLFMAVPAELPSTAMGAELLLYLERMVAVFAILVFLLVFLYRGFVHGELPKAISGRGAEWSDLAAASAATDELQAQVDELRAALVSTMRTLQTEGTIDA
jgi:hypothetical protein